MCQSGELLQGKLIMHHAQYETALPELGSAERLP
jgi:hypothetical protein